MDTGCDTLDISTFPFVVNEIACLCSLSLSYHLVKSGQTTSQIRAKSTLHFDHRMSKKDKFCLCLRRKLPLLMSVFFFVFASFFFTIGELFIVCVASSISFSPKIPLLPWALPTFSYPKMVWLSKRKSTEKPATSTVNWAIVLPYLFDL